MSFCKKIDVLRKDIISKSKFKRSELIRISFNKETDSYYPLNSYIGGKGVYIKKDIDSINLLVKKNLLTKLFKKAPDTNFIEELVQYIKKEQ